MNTISEWNQLKSNQVDLQRSNPLRTTEKENLGKPTSPNFSDVLSHAVDTLNTNNSVLNQDTQNLITGKEKDLGSVMTRMTEAQLTLQTAVQMRNKCLEAYNDLKNMQF